MPTKSARSDKPGALERIQRLRSRLEAEDPVFREASRLGRRAEVFSEGARADLKAQREQLGWDQARLGAALGYGQSAVSKIESGQVELTLKLLFKLSDALGLHPVIAFVPSARAVSGDVDADRPESLKVLERALAVEKAQAAMIRRMPEMMHAMTDIVSVELDDEDVASAALASEA